MPPMRVLVVGAGLAGLTAATRLEQQGLDVVVLEARNRVGGRVLTHRLDNGVLVELGGEWIDASQQPLRLLAEELGLRMVDTRQDFITRDLIGSDPIPDSEHGRLAKALIEVMESLSEDLDRLTIAALLDSIVDTSPAMMVLRSRLEGTFGLPLTEVSAADLDADFGLTQASSYLRVEGGNDRLATGMAKRLDVSLSTPVEHLSQDRTSVTVFTHDATTSCDFAVVAVPLPRLRRRGFLGDAPPDLSAAIRSVGMGTAAKVAVATVDEPPMFRRQEADIPGWYWTGAESDGSTRRAVTGFAGTAKGVKSLFAGLDARLARAVPETPLAGSPLFVDWGADRWAGGCYSALGPGQRDVLPLLQRPWHRVVFAGEHVNGTGTMDGAIRTGTTAAEAVLERV